MAKGVKPRVKVPKSASAGETITIKTLISHPMESGQRKDKDGNLIPRSIINRFTCDFGGENVIVKMRWGGLPDETVTASVTRRRRNSLSCIVTDVSEASPDRVEPCTPSASLQIKRPASPDEGGINVRAGNDAAVLAPLGAFVERDARAAVDLRQSGAEVPRDAAEPLLHDAAPGVALQLAQVACASDDFLPRETALPKTERVQHLVGSLEASVRIGVEQAVE